MTFALLDELAQRHGTDKGTADHDKLRSKGYTRAYAGLLAHRREEELTVLEIGIFEGGSLRTWEDYLPNARLFAVDINESCKQYASDRTKVRIGDQASEEFLASIPDWLGAPADFIIDDGGHDMAQHRASFLALWPHLAPGGAYVIEDMHTCHSERHGGGPGNPNSTIEWLLKPAVENLTASDIDALPVPDIAAVQISQSMAVFFKGYPQVDGVGGFDTARSGSSIERAFKSFKRRLKR